MREQGTGNRVRRVFALFLGVVSMALSAAAFAPIPKESAKALKVTRGKPFSSGAVFINGKFVEAPYVVERWGTGIRINGKQVTGQVVDWNEFLKTQKTVKSVRQEETGDAASAASASASAETASEDVNESSLDDLFDDDPKPKKKVESHKPNAVSRPKPPSETLALEGEFAPNETTKALVARINAFRTEVDRILRSGGFICFGDAYSRVTGDSRALLDMLGKLPEIQRSARDVQDFSQRIRAANMVYLNEVLRWDLYRNRVDYRRLQELRVRLQKDNEYQKVLDEVSTPLF